MGGDLNIDALRPYFKHFPNGRVRDLRNRCARGDTVRVTSGTFEGYLGVVDGVVFQKSYDFQDVRAPAYQIALEDGKWVTLRWDQVV